MWRSAARSIGACLALLCFFAVSSADPSPPSRADAASGVRVAQRLIDTIPSPWRLDGDVRMAGDDAPVAQGNFVQASYDLNKASLDSVATFSRAGNAMQFDSSGYLTYGPNNLLTQSNAFSNAAWNNFNISVSGGVADPFGGTNASTITATANNGQFYQTPNLGAAPNGIFAVWMRRRTGTGNITFRKPDGTTPIITVTSTWTQIYGVGANTGAANVITLATSGDAIDVYAATASAVTYETTPRAQDQVITTSAAYYGPRFDYTYNGSSWVPAGLLVEGAATNLQTLSGTTTDASWNVTGAVKSTDGTLAPDNSSLYAKVTANAGSAVHAIYRSALTITSGSTYAYSYYVKYSNHRYVQFITTSTAAGGHYITGVFDIGGTGDITATQTAVGLNSGTLVSATGKYLGGGVYRLTLVGSVAQTSVYQVLEYAGAATGNTFGTGGDVNYTAAGTEIFYATFSQAELGSSASSYTPTGASGVTRATDGVTFTGYTSNPFAILSAPESTGSYACNKYASQAAAISGVASPNQWVKSVKVWPVGTPSASQSC